MLLAAGGEPSTKFPPEGLVETATSIEHFRKQYNACKSIRLCEKTMVKEKLRKLNIQILKCMVIIEMSITNKQKYCDSFTIPLKSKIAYHQNAQATKVHHTKKIFGEANVIINRLHVSTRN